MNKIEGIIRPEKLDTVKNALAAAGLVGINVVQVTGRGAQQGINASGPRGVGSYVVDMLPKTKLELVVRDEDTQKAIDTIIGSARTGDIGDGKIFVIPVSNAICVRTGEEGDEALRDSHLGQGRQYVLSQQLELPDGVKQGPNADFFGACLGPPRQQVAAFPVNAH